MDANKTILDRHEWDKEYQQFLIKVKYYLSQYVNYSSNVLSWLVEKVEDNGIDHIIIWPLRNAFEALDGITVLLEDGCIRPTDPLFRIVYETIATVFFIGEKDSKQRARHYYVTYLLNQRETLGKYPKNLNQTEQLEFVLDAINKELEVPENQLIVEKYGGRPRANWFSKCGKDCPQNISELIRNMSGVFPKFTMYYSIYSNTVHGKSDWAQLLTYNNINDFAKLRNANDLERTVCITISFYNFLIDFVLSGIPEKKVEFWNWFNENVKQFYDSINVNLPM